MTDGQVRPSGVSCLKATNPTLTVRPSQPHLHPTRSSRGKTPTHHVVERKGKRHNRVSDTILVSDILKNAFSDSRGMDVKQFLVLMLGWSSEAQGCGCGGRGACAVRCRPFMWLDIRTSVGNFCYEEMKMFSQQTSNRGEIFTAQVADKGLQQLLCV